jgi:hypothetical protein
MIYGTRYWNDVKTFHIQDNNVFEETFRKKGVINFLESCGPTSAVNAILAMEGPSYFDNLKIGDFEPQPEDLLMLYFNDYRNYDNFRRKRSDVNPFIMLNNEVPQFYPDAVKAVFGYECEFAFEKDWERLKGCLKEGKSVMIAEPGHYTCIVAYDDDTDEVVYNDPWSGHYATGEFNLRYTKKYYRDKTANYRIVFEGKI